jgi:hypothetical protein
MRPNQAIHRWFSYQRRHSRIEQEREDAKTEEDSETYEDDNDKKKRGSFQVHEAEEYRARNPHRGSQTDAKP